MPLINDAMNIGRGHIVTGADNRRDPMLHNAFFLQQLLVICTTILFYYCGGKRFSFNFVQRVPGSCWRALFQDR